ncbi:MAG TPA: hypothetical protein VGM41_20515 [Chitinophagaceae bacterium]
MNKNIPCLRRQSNLYAVITVIVVLYGCGNGYSETKNNAAGKAVKKDTTIEATIPVIQPLDTAAYRAKIRDMINKDSSGKWPVKDPYPLAGAILPFNRIVAYYGNLYSKSMGVLGQYPRETMLAKLKEELVKWQAADTTTKVIPALHYIAVTAQGYPGKGNTYRLRMPFKQLDTVISMAKEINALVFIDVQVGHSTVQSEIPQFEQYLKMPNVHLGIDPEFSMKGGQVPGKAIGTFDAADINFVSNYLAKIVRENHLTPKIFVVHRFTQAMVTNYKQIKLQPEVQMVMDMDGWGGKAKKISSYEAYVWREPVQFTGFKLFYKNDFRTPGTRMMTPEEVMKLKPRPVYIQYQ